MDSKSPMKSKLNLGLPIKRNANDSLFKDSAKRFNSKNNSKLVHSKPISIQRQMLPVYKVKRRLLEEIDKNSTIIIIGETGCGKTTQIPQFIHDLRLESNKTIAITQPRRVAAITVAQRVASETNTQLGTLAGYCVRFEDVTSENTKLKYMTDGMLLREAMLDDMLMTYSIIILDEAHERTVQTDVLFGIVKTAQAFRKEKNMYPLKVILMSATMDVDHFSKYFNNSKVLYLEGRQYPVKMYEALKHQEDYAFSCLVTIFQIHKEAPPNHDILVFLTGQEEIELMAANIRSITKDPQCSSLPPLKVFTFYASMSTIKQLDVFRPTPLGARKVVLSTNVAETSVTISGIKYVIDSGMVKIRSHQSGTGFDILKVQRISQAQAWQRAGRAGRESNGICYRVYTKQEFEAMMKNPIPEIQRCNLTSVVLQLLAIKINALTFDFMDKPPKDLVIEAFHQLVELKAVDNVESPKLTELGYKLAQFPLDPRYSKIILSAKDFNCLEEILSIISVLSSENVFVTPMAKKEEANEMRKKFLSSSGDHISFLNIYRCFNNIKLKNQWCFENYLNPRNLEYSVEVRKQLADLCKKCGLEPTSCGQNLDVVRKCLLTGLFHNVAELQRDKQYITVNTRQIVHIHPSSALFGSYPPYVLFTELIQTGRCYMRNVSIIDPDWFEEIIPEYARLHPLSKFEE
uniref:RNA helicase n=1 Tax=Clastoptera arizonana TaxID=38151 RepID=A0A1B6DZY5_9HEMI